MEEIPEWYISGFYQRGLTQLTKEKYTLYENKRIGGREQSIKVGMMNILQMKE